MVSKKEKWGYFTLSIALFLCGLLSMVSSQPRLQAFPPDIFLIVSLVLVAIGLVWIGLFSYERIQSFRVYFISIITGTLFLGYAPILYFNEIFGRLIAERIAVSIAVVFLMVLAGALLLSNRHTFRTVRRITITTWALGISIVVLLYYWDTGSAHLTRWSYTLWPAYPIATAAVVIGALVRLKHEFFIGGIITGALVIACWGWVYAVFSPHHTYTLSFVVIGVFLLITFMWHLFVTIEHRMLFDPLLHIYNREYCRKVLAGQTSFSVAPPFSLAMVDIDHFKAFNDTHGHTVGDTVLRSVAQAVSKAVIGAGGITCRYGGEELIVFFPKTQLADATELIEKMRHTVENVKIPVGRKKLSVTVSCGVSVRKNFSDELSTVAERADKALYKAKKEGRNCVRSQPSVKLKKNKELQPAVA